MALSAVHQKAQDDFAAVVQTIEVEWKASQASSLKRIQDILLDYRNDVAANVAGGSKTAWKEHHLTQAKRALEQARKRMEAKLEAEWAELNEKSVRYAIEGVDEPLAMVSTKSKFSPYQLNEQEAFLASEYTPSLIRNVSKETHGKVQSALQNAFLGADSSRDLVRAVTSAVGNYKRARTIFRTESNRLHNLVRTSRIDDLAKKGHPGLGKKWVHRYSNLPRPNHTALHGTIAYPAEDDLFTMATSTGPLKIRGPHDPNLSAADSINCHCGLVATYDPSRIGSQPADERAAGEKQAEKIPKADALEAGALEAAGTAIAQDELPDVYLGENGKPLKVNALWNKAVIENEQDPFEVMGRHQKHGDKGTAQKVYRRMKRVFSIDYIKAAMIGVDQENRPVRNSEGLWTPQSPIKLVDAAARRSFKSAAGEVQLWLGKNRSRKQNAATRRLEKRVRELIKKEAEIRYGDEKQADDVFAWYVSMGKPEWGQAYKRKTAAEK